MKRQGHSRSSCILNWYIYIFYVCRICMLYAYRFHFLMSNGNRCIWFRNHMLYVYFYFRECSLKSLTTLKCNVQCACTLTFFKQISYRLINTNSKLSHHTFHLNLHKYAFSMWLLLFEAMPISAFKECTNEVRKLRKITCSKLHHFFWFNTGLYLFNMTIWRNSHHFMCYRNCFSYDSLAAGLIIFCTFLCGYSRDRDWVRSFTLSFSTDLLDYNSKKAH